MADLVQNPTRYDTWESKGREIDFNGKNIFIGDSLHAVMILFPTIRPGSFYGTQTTMLKYTAKYTTNVIVYAMPMEQ